MTWVVYRNTTEKSHMSLISSWLYILYIYTYYIYIYILYIYILYIYIYTYYIYIHTIYIHTIYIYTYYIYIYILYIYYIYYIYTYICPSYLHCCWLKPRFPASSHRLQQCFSRVRGGAQEAQGTRKTQVATGEVGPGKPKTHRISWEIRILPV